MSRFVTGPGYIYVSKIGALGSGSNCYPAGTPAKADILYLGTCEKAPRIRLNPEYEPFMNDVGGVRLPIDYTYQGEDGEVVGTLTQWCEPVYQRIQKKPTVLGGNVFGEIGTMMQLEGATFHVWIQFPGSAKAYGATYGMPTCMHFIACRPIGEEFEIGTTAAKRLFAIKADRSYSDVDASIKCYDQVLSSSIPAAPILSAVNLITGVLL